MSMSNGVGHHEQEEVPAELDPAVDAPASEPIR
jgi:hypothetical protein